MKKILYLLGFIHALPLSIPGWIFGLFLLATKQIEKFEITDKFQFIWDMKDEGCFFKNVFEERGFWGMALGNNIFVKDKDDKRRKRSMLHENEHSLQMYKFGLIYLFMYFMDSLIIYIFLTDMNAYYDNYFEIEARKAAGQKINIPKSDWQRSRWGFW